MDSEGGGEAGAGSRPPEKSLNIGFLSNTGPDPLKSHNTTKQAFNVGPSTTRLSLHFSHTQSTNIDEGLNYSV